MLLRQITRVRAHDRKRPVVTLISVVAEPHARLFSDLPALVPVPPIALPLYLWSLILGSHIAGETTPHCHAANLCQLRSLLLSPNPAHVTQPNSCYIATT